MLDNKWSCPFLSLRKSHSLPFIFSNSYTRTDSTFSFYIACVPVLACNVDTYCTLDENVIQAISSSSASQTWSKLIIQQLHNANKM